MFPGSGPIYLVPDQYYKAGSATLSLRVNAFRDHPNWMNLVQDVNDFVENTGRSASIVMERGIA